MEESMPPAGRKLPANSSCGGAPGDGQASHKRPSADDGCAGDSLLRGDRLVDAHEQRSKAGSDLLLGRCQSVIDHIL